MNGCYALLLTPKGRIVADLHVLARDDGFWLETAAGAVDDVIARLDRYIVADDVKLVDRTSELTRLGVEGPAAAALLSAASATGPEVLAGLADACWLGVAIGGTDAVAARFGWSGESAFQLFVPAEAFEDVTAALRQAGGDALAPASAEALEVLRVEAGIPRLGPELHEEIFPDEARLDRAISRKKGCYTGQEIVARLYSRGAVNHLLVGLRFEGERVPALSAPLSTGDRATGEVTSACLSPAAGVIGLGFVRREHAEPGTALRCDRPGRRDRRQGLRAALRPSRRRPDVKASRGWIVVFAKAPRPGRVKTRLTPPFTPEQAASFYECLLDDVLLATAEFSRDLALEPVVAVHPPEALVEIVVRVPRETRVVAQQGRDLSERMSLAVREAAAGGASRILLRGSDSPCLDGSVVAAALDRLEDHDLVLQPERDGGYGLVGLRRPCPGLFDHEMSTASVLDETLARARARGLRVHLLPAGFDIDTVADLALLARAREANAVRSCPRTLAFLDENDLWKC